MNTLNFTKLPGCVWFFNAKYVAMFMLLFALIPAGLLGYSSYRVYILASRQAVAPSPPTGVPALDQMTRELEADIASKRPLIIALHSAAIAVHSILLFIVLRNAFAGFGYSTAVIGKRQKMLELASLSKDEETKPHFVRPLYYFKCGHSDSATNQ